MIDWMFCDVIVPEINSMEFIGSAGPVLIVLLIYACMNRNVRESYKRRFWLLPIELYNFRRNWAIATVATLITVCLFLRPQFAEICA